MTYLGNLHEETIEASGKAEGPRRTPLTVIGGYKVALVSDNRSGIYMLSDDECMVCDGKFYRNDKGRPLEITGEEV